MNKRKIGKEQEQIAIQFLEERGYQILDTNFWCCQGEIDIVAKNKEYLVFIEVKYRKQIKTGYPEEAVSKKKICSITRTAEYYLIKRNIPLDTPCRFDIISILDKNITLIPNAFETCY